MILYEEECDTKTILTDCKNNLYQQDSIQWHNDIFDDKALVNGNKLRTYRCFKTELKLENYVIVNVPLYKKKVFTLLRAGCLPLEVEKGRHKKPHAVPLNERLCNMCDSGVIEDERHFLMKCSLYNDIRESMFQLI